MNKIEVVLNSLSVELAQVDSLYSSKIDGIVNEYLDERNHILNLINKWTETPMTAWFTNGKPKMGYGGSGRIAYDNYYQTWRKEFPKKTSLAYEYNFMKRFGYFKPQYD